MGEPSLPAENWVILQNGMTGLVALIAPSQLFLLQPKRKSTSDLSARISTLVSLTSSLNPETNGSAFHAPMAGTPDDFVLHQKRMSARGSSSYDCSLSLILHSVYLVS